MPVNVTLQSEQKNQVIDVRTAWTGPDQVAQRFEKGIRIIPG